MEVWRLYGSTREARYTNRQRDHVKIKIKVGPNRLLLGSLQHTGELRLQESAVRMDSESCNEKMKRQ